MQVNLQNKIKRYKTINKILFKIIILRKVIQKAFVHHIFCVTTSITKYFTLSFVSDIVHTKIIKDENETSLLSTRFILYQRFGLI